MQPKIAVITGGGTGIGLALAEALIKRDYSVFVIGRRVEPLKTLQAAFPDKVEYLSLDISSKEASTIVTSALAGRKIDFLVHNAAVVKPFNHLMAISRKAWEKMMATNVSGPLFLTQSLLQNLKKGSRVLHIGSGAAHKVIPGIQAYCVSKAAFYSLYRNLRSDLLEHHVYVGSMLPGVVDTDMQLDVRLNQKCNISPYLWQHEKPLIIAPSVVAMFLAWLLCDVDSALFSEKEWNVYDEDHHTQWLLSPLTPVERLPEDDPALQAIVKARRAQLTEKL